MADSPHAQAQGSDTEPKYGGFTRFEVELEVSSLVLLTVCPSVLTRSPVRPMPVRLNKLSCKLYILQHHPVSSQSLL